MTNVTMKAVDTLHISSVKADNLAPGEQFEVSTAVADDLEKRGLATRVVAKGEKAEKAAPENKMEPAPANKAPISGVRQGETRKPLSITQPKGKK